ncbi:MAG: NAD-dependent epimerase/dehydratase family protein [Candidatus Promineifilaceae bacterium]
MPKTVLITGGAGFIGSHLADALLAGGNPVRLLDNLHSQVHGPERRPPAYLNPAAELQHGDVRDPAAVSAALDGVGAVYHLAAYTGVGQSMYQIADYVAVNAQGTAVLLEQISQLAAPRPRLILTSSRAIYGEGAYECPVCGLVSPRPRALAQLRRGEWEPGCPNCGRPARPLPTPESQPASPGSIYAASKQTQELLVGLVGQSYDFPAVILRLFNVYGPRQALDNPYTGVINAFLSRLKAGKAPLVYEDGRESRDFVHVADVVQALVLALGVPAGALELPFNVGSGRALNMLAVAEMLSKLSGGPAPAVSGQYRAGDIRHCFADLGRSQALLGYQPQVDFESGLADLVSYLAAEDWDDRSDEAQRELRRRGLAAP